MHDVPRHVRGHANRARLAAVWIVLILGAVFVSGCGTPSESEARSTALEQSKQEILIAAVWPFESWNELFREGALMAVEEVNASGGILGRSIKLDLEDDQDSVTAAMAIAQKLAGNPQVAAVIGHRTSSISLPVSSIYNQAELLMLSQGATSPKLTSSGHRLVFRTIPSDEQIGLTLARFASEQGYRKVAVYYADNEYGRGLANLFEDMAEKQEITIVDRVSGYNSPREVDAIASRWKLLDCDAVFIADTMPGAAEIITEIRKSGIQLPIFGGDGLDSTELVRIAGSAAEGIVSASVFNPADPDPNVQRFVAGFRDKYGKEPTKWAAQGYDAVKLLAEAMHTAGSPVPSEVAKALRSMSDWAGVSGTNRFDEYGDEQGKKLVLKVIRNGKFELLK